MANVDFKEYPLSQTQAIVWNDMDALQHINNTVYFRYFEDVRVVMLEALKVFDFVKSHNIGPVVASTRCDYRAPLVYPDTITTISWVENIQEKRYTMKYEIHSHNQQRCVAEGEALIVYCDFNTGKSCPIPAETLEGLQAYVGGQ
ncbi:Long-chain acyl-CoA thioesterase FadM [Grimontia celer]|uniref:Long-chain acyl-CoA thioesterase FadM n=1 Tax=Grimontia celer TaxID=1796497 RepID=A0A128F830_9GAMM|nr:thioesterase family protein [Grimontia celer]CZF82973.1 Long-chain acyl-CoA thioesterase FadM [Grimontia celer]